MHRTHRRLGSMTITAVVLGAMVGGAQAPPASAATLPSAVWQHVGPAGQTGFRGATGRVEALAIDPSSPATVYAGGVQGGVWKTTTGGQSWTPLTDGQPDLAVGALAVAPTTPTATIFDFAGMIGGYPDHLAGGLLASTDGGATWSRRDANHLFDSSESDAI